MQPYADEQWWVLALLLGGAVLLTGLAGALLARRDAGAGVLPPRLGRPTASRALHGPFGLAWRLHRGLLLGWSVGFAAVGLVMGGAVRSVDQLTEGSDRLGSMIRQLGGAAELKDTYVTVSLGMLALAAGAYAVQATLRMRAEETGLRAEPLLSTATGRLRWMASHLVFVATGPAVALAVLGAATGLASSAAVGNGVADQVTRVLAAGVVQVPAVWVLAGLTVAMFGLLPRAAAAVAWGVFAACAFLSFLGPLLQLDDWVLDLSPYAHIPDLPGGDVTAGPLVTLVGVAVALTVLGLAGFRRRDVG